MEGSLKEHTDVNVFVAISEALDEESPCESRDHGNSEFSHAHDEGAGEWYMHFDCSGCSTPTVKLYCNAFHHIITSRPDALVICAMCNTLDIVEDVYISSTKKKGL